jgi:hypothetical protein
MIAESGAIIMILPFGDYPTTVEPNQRIGKNLDALQACRTSASSGKLFFRLVQHLLDVDPVPRPTLVGLCKGDTEDEFDKNGAEVVDHFI